MCLCVQRAELDSVAEEMQHWRLECNNVEMMRRNALDSLRLLETEVTQLQDADIQLKQMKDEYNTLRGQVRKLLAAVTCVCNIVSSHWSAGLRAFGKGGVWIELLFVECLCFCKQHGLSCQEYPIARCGNYLIFSRFTNILHQHCCKKKQKNKLKENDSDMKN